MLRVSRRPWWLLVLVSIPFAVGAVQILLDARTPFYLTGDQALIEIAVRRTVELLQFTGPYSRFGWDHPGPLYYFFLAPGVFLVPNGFGIYFGALFLNWCFAIVAIALLVRTTAPRIAAAVTTVVLAYLFALGPFALRDPWNPEIVVVPLVAALIALAVRPSTWSIAIGSIACSLALQSHFGTVSAVAALIVTAAFVHLLSQALPGADWLRGTSERRWLPRWRSTFIVAGVTIFCWLLPIVEQLAHGRRGNFGRVIYFNLHNSRGERHSLGEAAAMVLGGNWWPAVPILRGPEVPPGNVWLWVAGWLLAAALGAGLAARRKMRVPFVAFAFACIGFVVITLATSRITGPIYVYLLWWVAIPSVAMIAGWVALVLGENGLLRRLPGSISGSAVTVLALAATVAVTALTAVQPSLQRFSRDDVRQATTFLESDLGGQRSGVIRLEIPDPEISPYAQGVATELYRDGFAVQTGGGLARSYETRASKGAPIATFRLAKAGSGNDQGGRLLGRTASGESMSVRRMG